MNDLNLVTCLDLQYFCGNLNHDYTEYDCLQRS